MTALSPADFGSANTLSGQSFHEASLPLETGPLDVALWLDEGTTLEVALTRCGKLASDPTSVITKVQNWLKSNPGDPSVAEYIQHHQDELPELPGDTSAFLELFKPVTLSLEPAAPEVGRLDFSIGFDLSQYVMCLALSAEGDILSAEMES